MKRHDDNAEPVMPLAQPPVSGLYVGWSNNPDDYIDVRLRHRWSYFVANAMFRKIKVGFLVWWYRR